MAIFLNIVKIFSILHKVILINISTIYLEISNLSPLSQIRNKAENTKNWTEDVLNPAQRPIHISLNHLLYCNLLVIIVSLTYLQQVRHPPLCCIRSLQKVLAISSFLHYARTHLLIVPLISSFKIFSFFLFPFFIYLDF